MPTATADVRPPPPKGATGFHTPFAKSNCQMSSVGDVPVWPAPAKAEFPIANPTGPPFLSIPKSACCDQESLKGSYFQKSLFLELAVEKPPPKYPVSATENPNARRLTPPPKSA